MDRLKASGFFLNNNGKLKINLSVISFKEDDVFIIYCPSLDVSGYGYSKKEAEDSFNLIMADFFNEATVNGTLLDELKRLGWKITSKDNSHLLIPPSLDEMLRDNDHPLKEIWDEKDFSKHEEELELAC